MSPGGSSNIVLKRTFLTSHDGWGVFYSIVDDYDPE